ncbi:acyl carrier protein 2, chloroplastic-like [Amaranthus tricolor]|uniref:acyl carrier protein 2, chloroplastic-like n=1 Tax=Amaranthus tricolor TaxID=29722 RepID=UPI0025865AFD|nr:acyl carrier protein 2, chloroplastic-like [Amaranthus tricolor]
MASSTGSSMSVKCCPQRCLRSSLIYNNYALKSSVSFVRTNPRAPLRFRVSCAANTETVNKVSAIVRKQLALTEDREVTGETKFSELGADSLDTVEIVMKLEEEFCVTVEEESAQNITTIKEAADLIDSLKK